VPSTQMNTMRMAIYGASHVRSRGSRSSLIRERARGRPKVAESRRHTTVDCRAPVSHSAAAPPDRIAPEDRDAEMPAKTDSIAMMAPE
jgi:hypothetical protein